MKNSLKTLLSLVALGLAVSVSTPLVSAADETPASESGKSQRKGKKGEAGRGGGGDMISERRIAEIDKAVGGLTAEQKTKLNAIYARTAEETRAARENMSDAERKEGRGKMGGIAKETRTQVLGVLTEEQRKKFEAMPKGEKREGAGQRKKKNQ